MYIRAWATMLMNAVGEGGAGGGGGQQGQQQGQQGQQQGQQGQQQGQQGQGQQGGAAPGPEYVSREEFNKLAALLQQQQGEGKSDQGGKQGKSEGQDMPEWAKEWAKSINSKIDDLTGKQAAEQLEKRRTDVIGAVLQAVPEPNRETAKLALEGLAARLGVKFEGDVSKLTETLRTALQQQAPTLFASAGSPYAAIPQTGNGQGYDWSGVTSLAQVPADMIKHIPDDVWRRLRNGTPASSSTTGGWRPVNNFT